MKTAMKFLTVLVALAMLLGMSAYAATGYTEESVFQNLRQWEGKTVLSWDMFWNHSTSNAGKSGTMTQTKVTDGMGLFAEYLSYDLTAFGASAGRTDTQIRLRDNEGTAGFQGAVAPGETMMLHVIMRATPDDVEKPMKFHMSVYSSEGGSSAYVSTSAHPEGYFVNGETDDIPTTWTEYYIPLQANATYGPDMALLFLNPAGGTGTVDLARYEIINYGTEVAYTDLPWGTFDLSDYTASGRTVVDGESFYRRATKSAGTGTAMTLTRVSDDAGMFSRYLRADATKLGSSYKNLQVNYLDYGSATTTPKGWELFGNAKAGDTALIHMIARSNASDGEGSFRLAYYQQGVGSSDSAGTATALEKMTVGSLWTEFYIPVTTGSVDPNRLSVFFGYEVQTLDIALLEVLDFNDMDISELPASKEVIELGYGEETDFFSLYPGEGVKTLTGTTTVSLAGSSDSFYPGDMLLYSFTLRADKSTPVTISVAGKEMEYFVPAQWTRFDMPIATAALGDVTIRGDVQIRAAKFVNYKGTAIGGMNALSGPHMEDDFQSIVLSEGEGIATGGVMDIVKSGNFVYSIGSGNFVVTDVTDPENPVVRGKLSGMGSAIRQMDICKSGVDVFITSRSNGAYIVNVSDPDNPVIRSQYDSIEMATGLCVYEDYAFICNRQYGVEIVDISDLDKPRHVTNILTTGTVQSCQVLDGILYCGQWAQCCVSLYDVTNIDAPVYMNDVPLNGKGDGMTVLKDGDKTYIYAATGQHNQKATDSGALGTLDNLNFGQGNAMDIIDVTDPMNPQWLSTSSIDGRYYYADCDYWTTMISEDTEGNRYAYFMNTFNGVYVFNVNDPTAPVRLAHITIQIPTTSANYKVLKYSGRETVLPWDQSLYGQDAVASIYAENGRLYLGGNKTGLHILRDETMFFDLLQSPVAVPITNPEGSYYAFDGSGYEGFKSYAGGSQFYAAVAKEGYLYVAAGAEGILVFDEKTMTLQKTYPTEGAVMDLALYENKLYAAERTAGLGGYEIGEDGTLTEILRYVPGQNAIRGVRLSPRGRFAVVMYSSNNTYVVDIQDPANPTQVLNLHANSHLYHRNLAGPIDDRYVVSWACAGNEYWIDFGEGDTLQTPVQLRKIDGSATNMRGSVADLGDGTVLATRGNGYVIYDPADTTVNPRSCTLRKDADYTDMTGKALVHGNLLVLSNRIDRAIWLVDISDVTAPAVIRKISVNGNPDLATISGDYLYVPMGYQGLFRFKLSGLLPAKAVCGSESAGYVTLQEALDASEGGYVKLMGDVTEDITLKQDAYLDLNGHTLSGTITLNGNKLMGMDSATDTFDDTGAGAITATFTDGAPEKHIKTTVTGQILRYVAVPEAEGYSFHRLYLSIATVSLRPSDVGVTYRSVFAADETLLGYMSQENAYGVALNLGSEPGDLTEACFSHFHKDTFTPGLTSGQPNARTTTVVNVLAEGEDNAARAAMEIYGRAYVQLADGTVIMSSPVRPTFQGVMKLLDDNWDRYTQIQKNALNSLYATYSDLMQGWGLENIGKKS